MSSPFVAEIRIFGFNFAPTGWAQCNGQLLPISQNTALFSLLGTMYGGDGKSTFALPNIQDSVALSYGRSSTGTEYFEGQSGGVPFVTLLESEIPLHSHTMNAAGGDIGDERSPIDRSMARTTGVGGNLYGAPSSLVQLAFQALPPAGGSLPHNNMMPFLVLNFCIAMQGIFPPRP
jgi:microcystin-dependent protein